MCGVAGTDVVVTHHAAVYQAMLFSEIRGSQEIVQHVAAGQLPLARSVRLRKTTKPQEVVAEAADE